MLACRSLQILLAASLLSLQLLPGPQRAVSQEPHKLIDPKAGPHPTLEQVVEKLTVRAEKLGCNSDDCALLVMNFASISGSTVMLDSKLADQLASIFVRTLPHGKVIERPGVRDFLARERIPYDLLKSTEARRWLGKELGATTVVVGDLDVSGTVPQAMFTLFDAKAPEKVEYFASELPATAYSPADLQASEPFGPRDRPKTTKSGAVLYRTGIDGVGAPSCSYMPNPPYTEAAREAQVDGVVVVDAIVMTDGTVDSPQIVKGVPGGLNEVTRKTIETWRCKPALKDNQPVATVVQFEVNFRLFPKP